MEPPPHGISDPWARWLRGVVGVAVSVVSVVSVAGGWVAAGRPRNIYPVIVVTAKNRKPGPT